MNRSAYNEFEDVRMLKWLARKDNEEAPLGINLWQLYVNEYGDMHTAQSLNGRMRRQIVPNLLHYVKWLKRDDLISVYKQFRERLTDETKKEMKEAIIALDPSGDYRGTLFDDDDDVSVEAPPSVPHKNQRKKKVSSFRNREEPPDDMDEEVPPLSVYKRKPTDDSRVDIEGPSTSRGPISSVKRPRPASDVRRKRAIEDDDDDEFRIPTKRKVIGEVSSTANLQSDDEEEVEDVRRSLKKKSLKKREERDKSPEESALDITIHNVVGVVSSTASIHHREEPTSSGRPVIQSPDLFTSSKKNTLVTSDDDIFLSPKQSPKRVSKKSAPRRRDRSEELEKPEDDERYRSPKQAPSKKRTEGKRRPEYEEEDDFSPVRTKKPVVPVDVSDEEEDAEEYVTPKTAQSPKKKKLARTLDDYYMPAPAKKQPSEDEFDVYERSLTKKAKKVNGSVSPKKAGPSATVPTLLSPRREEEEDDFDVFESSPVKKKVNGNTKKSSVPAPALMSPRREYDDDDEFAMFRSSKKKKTNGMMSPKKAAPSTSAVLESRIEDDDDDDFAMFRSSKKKKSHGIVTKKATPPRAVSPQKPAVEEEEEDDSDYVSPKSTPRKQKISVNSEDDEIVVKPTEQAADLSEPDDDDYVSPASSPIPNMGPFSGVSDEEEEDLQLTSAPTKIEKKSAVPESSSRMKSPVKSPQKPSISTRPSQRYQVDTEDEEVEKIMMSSKKASPQKSPQKMSQKEPEVQKSPKKAMFSPRRRTSDEKDDEADESEIDKTMRLFETPLKKTTTPKKLPASAQKPVQPIEDEDDDLADRIMATIRERKSLPTVETRVEPEQDPFEEQTEDAVESEKEEEKQDELSQSPIRGKISGGGVRLSAGHDVTRNTVDDDLMTSGPLVREDLVSPSRGLETPGQMNSLQRKRPSYVGMPAPKDDRPDYHWIEDKRGFKRWMRKPAWLLALEAEEAREDQGMMSPMTSPAHDPEASTEDEEPVANGEGEHVQKNRIKRTTKRKRRAYWSTFGRKKKKQSAKAVDTDDEEMPTDLPEEVMTEDEEPIAEVDTEEEEEEEEAHSSTALPKKHRVEHFPEGEYFYTVDKLGRKRKYPRKKRPLPRPDVLANMVREGLLHTATPAQRDKLLGIAEEPKKVEARKEASRKEEPRRGQPVTEEPVKKRRGRPPKKKFIEVEQSPEMDDDPMPGTSSIIRVPPLEVQNSLRSTCPEGEDDGRTFSFQQWNLDMRPVAEQAARSMYTEMFQHLEGRLIPESELRDIVQGDNVQQLFDKMFKEDEQQGEEDFVIVGVESFSAKKLRLKYFVKVQEELKKHTNTPHVRSAVLTFFQYFEYTVAATVTGKNFDTYIFLMDRLIDVAIPLATF